MNSKIAYLLILAMILVIILIQIFLAKRKNKWAGLVLPALTLIWSFIYPALNSFSTVGVNLAFVLQLISVWAIINIQTLLLLGIYLWFQRRKQ